MAHRTDPSSRRGFLLTLDAMVAIALLAAAFAGFAALTANNADPGATRLQPLAYDYLVGAHTFDNTPITTGLFATMTNLTLSEPASAPASPKSSIAAKLRLANALCDCGRTSTCIIQAVTLPVNITCLTTKETTTLTTFNASITLP